MKLWSLEVELFDFKPHTQQDCRHLTAPQFNWLNFCDAQIICGENKTCGNSRTQSITSGTLPTQLSNMYIVGSSNGYMYFKQNKTSSR